MFCPNCGTQLPDDARFCAGCGSPMPDTQAQQTPIPEEPPVTPEVSAAPVNPEVPKKKSKRPVILGAVLVLALAVAVWMLFFSKKTVYLVTYAETTSYSGNRTQETILEYEYDDLGNLLSYSNLTSVTGEYSYESGFEIGYKYTKDGMLKSAEGESGGSEVEFEYFYNDDGILEKVMGQYDSGVHTKATCDDDGRIECIKSYASNGELFSKTTFEYDKDGKLAEKKQDIGSYVYLYTYENNQLVEQIIKYEGEIQQRYVYAYSDKNFLTEQTVYDGDGKILSSMLIDATFKGKKLTGLVITMADNDGKLGEISGEAEWDGRTATIELDFDVSSENESTLPEDAYMELEYDKHGNLLSMKLYADDELVQEQRYEYQKVRVPRNYEKFWSGDPIWMTNG